MEYLCEFTIESIKRQRNCSISGEIHLLPVRTTKQAKIRKNQGRSHLYLLRIDTAVSQSKFLTCDPVVHSLRFNEKRSSCKIFQKKR